MNTRIQEIKERVEKATPGDIKNEWHYDLEPHSTAIPYYRTWIDFRDQHYSTIAEADFIAHARQDIPWLLDYIEKMEKALEGSCEHFEYMAKHCVKSEL
jgi:hypothetical protein